MFWDVLRSNEVASLSLSQSSFTVQTSLVYLEAQRKKLMRDASLCLTGRHKEFEP